jgi:hypothetical protein
LGGVALSRSIQSTRYGNTLTDGWLSDGIDDFEFLANQKDKDGHEVYHQIGGKSHKPRLLCALSAHFLHFLYVLLRNIYRDSVTAANKVTVPVAIGYSAKITNKTNLLIKVSWILDRGYHDTLIEVISDLISEYKAPKIEPIIETLSFLFELGQLSITGVDDSATINYSILETGRLKHPY